MHIVSTIPHVHAWGVHMWDVCGGRAVLETARTCHCSKAPRMQVFNGAESGIC